MLLRGIGIRPVNKLRWSATTDGESILGERVE